MRRFPWFGRSRSTGDADKRTARVSSIIGNKINRRNFDGMCKGGRQRGREKGGFEHSRGDSKTDRPFLIPRGGEERLLGGAGSGGEGEEVSPPGRRLEVERLGIWLGLRRAVVALLSRSARLRCGG
jgi:hypothetical protein